MKLRKFTTKSLFIVLFCLTSYRVFAQKAPIKFGEIDPKQITMKIYDKDPEAEAVILCDYGITDFIYSKEKGFYRKHERTTRIKILKTNGTSWGIVEIPYYIDNNDKEKVLNIKGYTYNEEGGKTQKIKLEKDGIYDTKLNANWGSIKLSLPNVKPGSVIEYTYEINSPFNIQPWTFQDVIPIVWSEYRLAIPEYYEYVQIAQGFRPFDISEKDIKPNSITITEFERSQHGYVTSSTVSNDKIDYQDKTYRWVMKDVPAFKNEKYITTPEDYLSKIEFQLSATKFPGKGYTIVLGTWEKLSKELFDNENFGGYMGKRGAIKTLTASIINEKTTPKDKMNAIYEYVKNNFQYEDKDGILASKSPKELIESKTGNSQDINMLLIMMLKEADVEVYPVLSSTRKHGKVNMDYPLVSKFNYVTALVKIGEETHLLDATDPMRPINSINGKALSGAGLVLIEKNPQPLWVPMQNVTKSSDIVIGSLNIETDGKIKGTITTQHKGYAALRLRKKLISAGNKEKTTSDIEEDKEIKKSTYKNIKEYDKPLEGIKPFESSEYSQTNNDFIYISPMLEYQMKENPFKQEERLFPVDYSYPSDQNYYITLVVPEGYKIEELPKSARFAWEDGSVKYDYLVQAVENRIQIVSKFTINKAVFEADVYKHLRDMYANIVAKQAEQIVLKKK